MTKTLLKVEDLKVSFLNSRTEKKIRAVRGVSFDLKKGEILGIVGESGSGKSVTSLAIMNLLNKENTEIEGKVLYKNQNLLRKKEEEMNTIRGRDLSMIFQDPMTSLNPVFTIGNQISDVIRRHKKVNRKKAREKTIEMLELVGIASAEERLDSYPHEFSGGMKQRVLIAQALSCAPDLLIADEPTTALDVTIQAQILDLLLDLKERLNLSIILITHDLGVIANTCSKIAVMYSGKIMEEGDVADVFKNPLHPYTRGLLESLPDLNVDRNERLRPIPGNPPDISKEIKACPFVERCKYRVDRCRDKEPPYFYKDNRRVMCWLLDSSNGEGEYYGKNK